MSEAARIERSMARENDRRADRIFARVLLFQWVVGVILAFWFSPDASPGTEASPHPHLLAAAAIGALLAAGPLAIMALFPDSGLKRHAVALAQISFSPLFIHVSGGRIETHFHVFVSLAFLAFYRSQSVVWLATAATVADHLIRSALWPDAAYGVSVGGAAGALEHGAWVLFEAVVLVKSIRVAQRERRSIAESQVRLQEALEHSAKMSALGEFMSGVAHEINNPLAAIKASTELFEMRRKAGGAKDEDAQSHLSLVARNVGRIICIVKSLKAYSRQSSLDPMEVAAIGKVANDVAEICGDSVRAAGIRLTFEIEKGLDVECRPSEIEQVLLNLIANSRDAIAALPSRWIRIEAKAEGGSAIVSVIDSGPGIPEDVAEQLMTPFFTTKPPGIGTGLGLAISRRVLAAHGGDLTYGLAGSNTCFRLRIPLRQPAVSKEGPDIWGSEADATDGRIAS